MNFNSFRVFAALISVLYLADVVWMLIAVAKTIWPKKTLLLFPLLTVLSVDSIAKCGIPATHRSSKARIEFMRQTGYPHGRKGWIVDHIKALCVGGSDTPANMQWQTIAEAKKKDRVECVCPVKK